LKTCFNGKLILTLDMTVNKIMRNVMYILVLLLFSQMAQAKLEIEIIQGNASALPIAVVPMQ